MKYTLLSLLKKLLSFENDISKFSTTRQLKYDSNIIVVHFTLPITYHPIVIGNVMLLVIGIL